MDIVGTKISIDGVEHKNLELKNSYNKLVKLKNSLKELDNIKKVDLENNYEKYFTKILKLDKVPTLDDFKNNYEKQLRKDLVETAFKLKSDTEINNYYKYLRIGNNEAMTIRDLEKVIRASTNTKERTAVKLSQGKLKDKNILVLT